MSDKECTKCKVTKPLSEFYNQRSRQDGKTSQCAECIKAKQKAYAKTPEGKETKRRSEKSEAGKRWKKRAQSRYAKTDNGKEKNKEKTYRYRDTERGREIYRAIARDQYAKHPNHMKAIAKVNFEVKQGRMPHVSIRECKYCHTQAQQYHHYLGYEPEHWLDVEPVCRKCHTAIHHAPSNLS